MPTKHFQKAVFQEKNMWIRIRKKKKMKKNLHMQLQGSLIKKKCKVAPLQSRPVTLSEHLTHCEMKAGLLSSRNLISSMDIKHILMSWLFKNVFLSFVLNALFYTSVCCWHCRCVQQVWITIVQQFNVMAYFHYRDLLARSAPLCLEIYLGLVDHWQVSYSFYLKLFCTIKG